MKPGTPNPMYGRAEEAAVGLPQAWNSTDAVNMLFTNSDRTADHDVAASASGTRATTPHSSGKWYAEIVCTQDNINVWYIGLCNASANLGSAPSGANNWMYRADGRVFTNGSVGGLFTSISSGQTVMLAFDATAGKLWIGANGTWFNSGAPASGTGEVSTIPTATALYIAARSPGAGAAFNALWAANFGHTAFTYTPPSGFTANG